MNLFKKESPLPTVGTRNEATRAQWVASALMKLPPGGRLLDVGAGEQRYRKFCDHLVYVSQDFGRYDPTATDSGLQMEKWGYGKLDIISDLTQIPQQDSSFDAILCTEVLEHVPDPLAAIREFQRLLKPRGQLIVSAPFCSYTHFAPFHFYTGFTSYFYEHHLPACGFTIVEMERNGNYFEFLAQELWRLGAILQKYGLGERRKDEQRSMTKLFEALERCSATDTRSGETLCFGIHIRAIKKS